MRAVSAAGIRDERVVAALRAVPRARFVPPGLAERAYEDAPLPIPHDQVTTQPSLVARMVEALELRGNERVLEIGAGLGFQTALLAALSRIVWSLERWPDLAEAARRNLARHGTDNAEVVVGDGTLGLAKHAPYDAVVVAAAAPTIPGPLVEQLATGGRLVHPVGHDGNEDVVLFVKGDELRPVRSLTGARFVPLVGRYGVRTYT